MSSKHAKKETKDSVDSQKQEEKLKPQEEKVYFEGRLCKLTIKEEVKEVVDGKLHYKVIKKPHPLYQRAADLQKHYDLLLKQLTT